MGELAVGKPKAVDAAGVRPGGIEEGELEILQRLGFLDAAEVGDVQHPHPRGLLALLVALVGHRQHVAGKSQGIAARGARRGRRQLGDHHGFFGMRDVHNAQAPVLALMRQVEKTPAIRPLLDRQTLAAVTVAVQVIVANQNDVLRFGSGLGSGAQRSPTDAEAQSRHSQKQSTLCRRCHREPPRCDLETSRRWRSMSLRFAKRNC